MSEFETGAAATAGEEYKTETWLDASCFVKAKPEAVIAALVDPVVVNKWFTIDCRADLRAGGELYWKWSDTQEETSLIKAYEPGKRLVCEWNACEGIRTTFEMTLEWNDEKQATRVGLHEGPFPCTEKGLTAYNDLSNGWGHELLAMRMWLEHGIDTRHAWNKAQKTQ